ncbi:MAG: TRAP transporter substrate-binding protein DctP, partial [Pseudomonadales bacterium]|nr:TRAP transporter substrate-binding protein DctP [Pseudomonadales bacterium]
PELQVYNLPLQFRNFEEVEYVRKRMDPMIIEGLNEGGIVSFHLIETGFAYILSKDPVRSVEDLDKVKAWVPEGDPVSADMVQAFGLSPIPLQITDVLAGLQTGLIDAVAVPPIVALTLQWHNHVNYITDLPIMYIYSMLALDKGAFNSISEADQAIVYEVMNRVFEEVDDNNREGNIEAYQALLNQGIKEVKPSAEDLPAWNSRIQRSITYLIENDKLSPRAINLFTDYLAEARRENSDEASGVSD